MTDALWQSHHYSKKSKKKSHRHHRDFPWDESAPAKPEAPITSRLSYKQRIAKRTWFPTIGDTELADTVIWHNTINFKDHLGRSWVLPPISYVPNPTHECYLPKSRIHKYSFHTSSVTNVEMFPIYGHLILSSSLDTTVRIWSLSGDRQCLQTYIGHTQGVRDCVFMRDGLKFWSACFGKRLKLWDTETGIISGALLEGIPAQIAIGPGENDVVCALQDGRAVQYDFRTGSNCGSKPVAEYCGHTAGLSAVAFLPGGRFFVTAGEDSGLTLWELGNGEPVAQLKEIWMKPISALAVHPTKPFVAAQMQGNEVVVFKTSPSFGVDKKRSFTGHNPGAAACRMSISPDGTYLASGDATGALFIWDWESATLKKTFQLHEQVVSKAEWSPYNPSQVVTSSWDNSLCLLD
jgi:pre-mRNA-processing factor 17